MNDVNDPAPQADETATLTIEIKSSKTGEIKDSLTITMTPEAAALFLERLQEDVIATLRNVTVTRTVDSITGGIVTEICPGASVSETTPPVITPTLEDLYRNKV